MKDRDNLYNNFVRDFSNRMCSITNGNSYSNVIFLCIGSDRLIGDAFGPLVGSRLATLLKEADRLNVIGTLDNNVCLCNISEVLQSIRNAYTNPFIIAIDAALSSPNNIGNILVSDGGVCLGSSLNRNGITVGDMSVRGVVGRNCRNTNQNMIILQNVPLSRVVNMAEIVSSGIFNSINYECNE